MQTIVEIANTDGPAGTYELSVATSGGLEAGDIPASIELAPGERKSVRWCRWHARNRPDHGDGSQRRTRWPRAAQTLALGHAGRIRAGDNADGNPVAANGSITIDDELLAQSFLHGSTVSVSVSRTPGFDVSALLTDLDRYPYGCAEQTTSRALPLLYLSDLDAPKELLDTPDLEERMEGRSAAC